MVKTDIYKLPCLRFVAVRVERGFADSPWGEIPSEDPSFGKGDDYEV